MKPISESEQSRLELCDLIYDTYNTLKHFGKQVEAMKSYSKVFNIALEDYNILEIRNAFKHYWKTRTDLPAPADIIKLIQADKKEVNKPVLHSIEEERKRQEAWANGTSYE